MSGIPTLKKKLKGIRATEKLSKAMKTVSMAKLSRLNALQKTYSRYAEQYRFFYENTADSVETANETKPLYVIVIASNRGFCGVFNSELVNFAVEDIAAQTRPVRLIACGEQTVRLLNECQYEPERCFIWNDIPQFSECRELFDLLSALAQEDPETCVRVIYPKYINTMTQTPTAVTLALNGNPEWTESALWVPDRETVLAQIGAKGFRALMYGMILESAVGAQAATLITMRSAYDTATQYGEMLELQIQRKRQSEVTADVIETSAERGNKGDGEND